ncbi:MAG: DNA-binding MarR family transcriptional regulator [Bermanella sp.]
MPLTPEHFPATWQRYRYNFMRYITAITRHTERQAMEQLTARGYPKLAMSFSAPLSLLVTRPLRLTELADTLCISKQLCLQSLKPIEQAGYIERRADSADKRAKLVALTAAGEQLIAAALEEMEAIHSHYEGLIGVTRVNALSQCLGAASRAIRVPGDNVHIGSWLPVSARITPLARTLQDKLMQITASKGHALQFSFGQVLGSIDLDGTPVAALAQANGVTTQAISRIAGELESLGYVRRASNSPDRRSRQLYFTRRGLELTRDSVASVQTIADELIGALGKKQFLQMESLSRALYDALELERGVLQDYRPALAEHLLSGLPTPPKSVETSAVLLFLASQIDRKLIHNRDGQMQFSPSALNRQSEASVAAIGKQLSASERAALDQLVKKLSDSRS